MPGAEPSNRSAAWQSFHRLWPWLAYAVGLLLREAGYGEAGAMVFMLGMLGHWRFWLLMIGCAAIGWWWGVAVAGPAECGFAIVRTRIARV